MFSYIKGMIAFKQNNVIVVETGGIGYKISTSATALERSGQLGETVQMFTYLYVRENLVELIGFLTMEELTMFELLIGVSGIGPKAALAISGVLSPSKFSLAVITDDAKAIAKAQGVGLKSAQRVILELKDKMKKAEGQLKSDDNMEAAFEKQLGSVTSEASEALMVLGYTASEANRAIASVMQEGMALDELIRVALKSLVKG